MSGVKMRNNVLVETMNGLQSIQWFIAQTLQMERTSDKLW